MLTAITIMAIVGGALAFNAVKFNGTIFCTTEATPEACTIERPGFTIVPDFQGEPSVGLSSCTDVLNGDCQVRATYMGG